MSTKFEEIDLGDVKGNCLSPFRTGYYRKNGFVVTEYYKQFSGNLENLKINDSDTIVCSFPKTGNNY